MTLGPQEVLRPKLLLSEPLPLVYVEVAEDFPDSLPFPLGEFELFAASASLLGMKTTSLMTCRFRGVSLERLPIVLRNGIDVDPSDAPIYADSFEKAWEYGGLPKLILALDPGGLERTFLEIAANTPPEELAQLQRRYPTVLPSEDGTRLWLSRLDAGDTRIASAYEYAYARWIPGSPFAILKVAFVFARQPDNIAGQLETLLPP